jgi:DNA-binding XRE family transcriptional regulator
LQDNLKLQRIAAGYKSASRFAIHVGIKVSTYIAIENGFYEASEEGKKRIAASLGKEVAIVFRENDPYSTNDLCFVKKTKISIMPLDQLEKALRNQFGNKLQPIRDKKGIRNEKRYIDL